MTRGQTDPELLRQLDAAASDSAVSAVCQLRTKDPDQKLIPPAETEAMVSGLMERVRQLTGEAPQRVQVFRNLGAFSVSAPPAFLRCLIEQEEIAQATANVQPEEMLIRPRPS
jgi:hypothetical protein